MLSHLNSINRQLWPQPDQRGGGGLHTGQAGIALYFAYYARFSGEERYLERAMEILEACFSSLEERLDHYNMCNGLAGLGWAFCHLVKEGFFEANPDEYMEDIDAFLEQRMYEDINNMQYDFLHSGLGLGVYFLERYPASVAMKNLPKIVTALETVSVADNGLHVWEDYFSSNRGQTTFNLGLAHGIPSIIAFLSRLKKLKICHPSLDQMLEESVAWVINQSLPQDNPSWFPCRKVDGQADGPDCRLAWCYGDPGIANTIWLAGEAMNKDPWKETATCIMQKAAKRSRKNSSIVDPSFCHGSAGVAHIFRQFYRRTGLPEFQKAAEYWMAGLIDNDKNRGGAGLWRFWPEGEGAWVEGHSLLNGLAGIGLVLVSAASKELSGWDRCFLLS